MLREKKCSQEESTVYGLEALWILPSEIDHKSTYIVKTPVHQFIRVKCQNNYHTDPDIREN